MFMRSIIAACVIGIVAFISGGNSMAVETQTRSPSTVTQTGPGRAWSNPGHAGVSDGNRATVAINFNDDVPTSKRLLASGYGFNVPAGKTIKGITASVEGLSTGGIDFQSARLIVNGTPSGQDKGEFAYAVESIERSYAFGGALDKWGLSLTPEIFNAPGFGLSIVFLSTSTGTVSINAMPLTVHFDD